METTIIIFIVSIIAGAYGALVGGGSLLIIPILVFLGVPPITAVASNRMGVLGITIGSIYNFAKKKFINWKFGLILSIPAFLGAYIGAHSIQKLPKDSLGKIIGIIILAILLITIFKKDVGLKTTTKKVGFIRYIAGSVFAFIIAFIGSIAGGVGTLSSYNLIYVFRQTFLESAGTRKIFAIVGILTATGVYISSGVIDYKVAAAIFFGTLIGGYSSSYFADKIGNLWVKRLFFVVVSIMAIKLLI